MDGLKKTNLRKRSQIEGGKLGNKIMATNPKKRVFKRNIKSGLGEHESFGDGRNLRLGQYSEEKEQKKTKNNNLDYEAFEIFSYKKIANNKGGDGSF